MYSPPYVGQHDSRIQTEYITFTLLCYYTFKDNVSGSCTIIECLWVVAKALLCGCEGVQSDFFACWYAVAKDKD